MRTLRASLVLSLFLLLLVPGVANATDTLDQQQPKTEDLYFYDASLAQTFTAGLSGGLDGPNFIS